MFFCNFRMSYVGVSEEEAGEPVELPVEEDGTGKGGFGNFY